MIDKIKPIFQKLTGYKAYFEQEIKIKIEKKISRITSKKLALNINHLKTQLQTIIDASTLKFHQQCNRVTKPIVTKAQKKMSDEIASKTKEMELLLKNLNNTIDLFELHKR